MKGLMCCGAHMCWAGSAREKRVVVDIFQCCWCWRQRVVRHPAVNPKYL